MPIRQRYFASVVLNASGAGSCSITARGDYLFYNTRWVVGDGVTPANQSTAQVTINGDDFQGTYSGNNDTSGAAHLMVAGDELVCSWTGGTPGQTAKITLQGLEYNAGEGMDAVGGGGGPLANGGGPGNPILGGTTLIRDAIQSSNFVPGISGWAIFRDGSYELGEGGTFRGDVLVLDDSGASVAILTNDGGRILFTPPTVSGLAISDTGEIFSSAADIGGGEGYTFTTINSPDGTFSGHVISRGSLFLGSSLSTGDPYPTFDTPDSLMEFNGDIQGHGNLHLDKLILAASGRPVPYVQQGVTNVTFAAATSNTLAVVFPTAFPAGVTPVVRCNINSGAGATARWDARAINITNTGFTIFNYRQDTADVAVAWTNIPVSWYASAVTM